MIRLGRITALQKPSGGVRGIVVGDIFRRLVARTIAQQMSDVVEAANAPYQCGLSTRAGMPFVRQFYGQPSMYLWESDDGTVLQIEQGEGGEQGDPLMPLLFALGQHAPKESG